MKTLKTIRIPFLIIIRLLLPSILTLLKYGVFVGLFYLLYTKSNTHLIKVIAKWIQTILETTINTPIILYRQDKFTGIVVAIVFLVIVGVFIFPKKSKFHFIGEDIQKIFGDLLFSIIYLFKSIVNYFKNKDLDSLNDNISFYFKTGIFYGINYFKLSTLEKKILSYGNSLNINLFDRINSYFKKQFNCSISSFEDNKESKIIKLTRPQNMKGNEFLKLNKDDLIFALGYSIEKYNLEITVGNEIELVFTVKNTGKILDINDFIELFKPDTYNFGLDSMGNLVSLPLNYSHANHLGIYGQTGNGKSVFSSSLIYGLLKKNLNYKFYVADPKGDFYWAKGVKNISYASNLKDIVNMVSEIKLSMEKTQNELNNRQSRNISEYLKLEDKKDFVKPTFILIEEFSYLLDLVGDIGKDEKTEFLSNVKNIVQVGRSSGYSLILSLQKPISEAIGSTMVKDMIKPISFKSTGSGEVIVFGEKTGLELDKLDIGEAIYFDNGRYKKFKSFYIDKSLLDNLRIDHKDDEINIVEKYYKYSREVNSFKLDEALKMGLSRAQFDILSKELQEKGILTKSSNNHLYFSNEK